MNQMPNYIPEPPKCGSTEASSSNSVMQKIQDWITTFIVVLLEELKARNSGPVGDWWLTHGVQTGDRDRALEYWFDTPRDLNIPEPFPALLEVDGRRFPVQVLGCNAGSVTLLANEPVEGDLRRAKLMPGLGILVGRLMDQLRLIADETAELNPRLALVALGELEPRPAALQFQIPELATGSIPLNCDQHTALVRIMTSEFIAVAGPRSAGKTFTAAAATYLLNRAGETVLFITPTTEAADEAAKAILKAMERTPDLATGKVVRLGHTSDNRLFEHPLIDTTGILLRTHPGLFEEIERLKSYENTLPRGTPRLPSSIAHQSQKQREQINQWQEKPRAQVDELRRQVLSGARVVITTLAEWLACKDIHSWRPDTIIVDEAHRMRPTDIFLLAARAKQRFVPFGELYGLPPWVRAKTKNASQLLKTSIFSLNGIKDKFVQRQQDSRLVFLPMQYGVDPLITKAINGPIYGGVLNNPGRTQNDVMLGAVERAAGAGKIVLYDTGTRRPQVRSAEPRSRFQLSTAAQSYGLACRLLAEGTSSLGLLNVHSGQTKILRALDAARRSGRSPVISTVQSLNVPLLDTVILDVTASGAAGRFGDPLIGDRDSLTGNYVNVGISATSKQLFILADSKGVEALESNSVLKDVFAALRREGVAFTPFPSESLAVDNPAAKCGLTFYASEHEVWPLLIRDLANARAMIAATWHAGHVENTLTEEFLCRWSPKSVPKLLAANITNAEVRERLARHGVHLTSPYLMGEPEQDPNVGEDSLLVIDSKVVWIPGWDFWGNTVRPWIRLQRNAAPRVISRLAFLDGDLEQAARGYDLPTATTEVAR